MICFCVFLDNVYNVVRHFINWPDYVPHQARPPLTFTNCYKNSKVACLHLASFIPCRKECKRDLYAMVLACVCVCVFDGLDCKRDKSRNIWWVNFIFGIKMYILFCVEVNRSKSENIVSTITQNRRVDELHI